MTEPRALHAATGRSQKNGEEQEVQPEKDELLNVAIALQLQSTIVLDDHLVHSDVTRLAWFREALANTAAKTQVVVLTCRPLDSVAEGALPIAGVMKDAEGTRVIDLAKVIKRR